MGYEDFIYFLLCDQARLTDRSLEYWFHLLDLDGDGVIRDQEMRYFYEEQAQRLECLNYETISFADVMCQMNDMISPQPLQRIIRLQAKTQVCGDFLRHVCLSEQVSSL